MQIQNERKPRRHELEINSGLLNVIVHGSVREYEESLRPIRIPLDKGLLGYRVFLIRADRQSGTTRSNAGRSAEIVTVQVSGAGGRR